MKKDVDKMLNYYEILGVEKYCSDIGKIKAAYVKMIRFFHPDQHNVSVEIAIEKTQQLNEARDILCGDLSSKKEYDKRLRMDEQQSSRSYEKSHSNTDKNNKQSSNANREESSRRNNRKTREKPIRHVEKNGISYDVYDELGVLSSSRSGWTKEVNVISWNNYAAKYDIRDWAPNHEKAGKGITLTRDECRTLYLLLRKQFGR